MQTTDQLEENVVGWAEKKGIIADNDVLAQIGKMVEEVTELKAEVIKETRNDVASNKHEIKMELGDVLVTCVIQAKLQGMTLHECLDAAYGKISKRTGQMKNGAFVKDE